MVEVPLNQGFVALIDDVDWPVVSQYKWYNSQRGSTHYAQANSKKNGKKFTLLMHRLIMSPPDGMFVDHKDGSGLNNQRANLRICTRSQNQMNSRAFGATSKYKGVSWCSTNSVWIVYLRTGGKKTWLGMFDCEEDAALAYDREAIKQFGEFAKINFPGQDDGRRLTRAKAAGSNYKRSDFTKEEIIQMFEMVASGQSQASVARKFGVSSNVISKILKGKIAKYQKYFDGEQS